MASDIQYKQDLPTIYAVHSRMAEATAPLYNRAGAVASYTVETSQKALDSVITPSTRATIYDRIRTFVIDHPRLSAFLAIHLALTGIPCAIFVGFAATTLISSLVTCLIVGTIVALTFTSICVGIALLFVVPVVLFTTFAATALFITAILGLWILRLINGPYGGNDQQIRGKFNALVENERVQRAVQGGHNVVGHGLKVFDRQLKTAVDAVDKYTGVAITKTENASSQMVLGRDAEGNVTVG